jgi:hypothetical protein
MIRYTKNLQKKKEMMNKQTAVEWLEKEISTKLGTNDLLGDLYKQAKAMEKEQIIDAANKLLYRGTGPGNTAAEQYYNETYGGDK